MNTTTLVVEAGALTEFDAWFKNAAAGDCLIYSKGDLQYDRQVAIDEANKERADERKAIATLNAIANRAWDAMKAGEVLLTQRRLGQSEFEYRATRVRYAYPGKKPKVRHDELVPA